MSGTGHTVKSYEEEMQSLNDNLVMKPYRKSDGRCDGSRY